MYHNFSLAARFKGGQGGTTVPIDIFQSVEEKIHQHLEGKSRVQKSGQENLSCKIVATTIKQLWLPDNHQELEKSLGNYIYYY